MRTRAIAATATLAPLLLFPVVLSPVAHAQAKETATEAIRLHVFGVGSYDRPAYGAYEGAGGFAVGGGAGFTVPRVHRLEPGFDIRYTYGTNQQITQTVFSGGLRMSYHLARFHPYGDIFIGSGKLNIKEPNPAFPNYTHDDSIVYTFGGGVDYDVTRTIGLRFDIQKQRWQLSTNGVPFYPTQASAGIRYQFHLHNTHGMD